MSFWNAPLGQDFPLGTDTAWTVIALGIIALVLLVLPIVFLRERGQRPELGGLLGARLGAVIAETARGAAWCGAGLALGAFALPGNATERGIRAALVATGIIAGALLAWRSVSLISTHLSRTTRSSRLRSGTLMAATGSGASGIFVAVLVAVQHHNAGASLIALAAGLAVFSLSLRAAHALASLSATAASIGVGALEQENEPGSDKDPGIELGVLARALADGLRRTLDHAALTALIPGVLITTGVPLFGTAAVISALILTLATLVAHLLTLVLPFTGSGEATAERRMRAIGGTLSGAFPVLGALAGLALWLPNDYAKLRMGEVGLANFTDPLLISLFTDPTAAQQGQVPQAVPRDQVEPLISQLADGFSEFYKTVGDAPSAQSVIDTIVLHTLNPAQLTATAIAVGFGCALICAAARAFLTRRGGREADRHTRSAHMNPFAIELSGVSLGVPLALLAVVGFTGAWIITASSAGIAYLAFYLAGVAAAALATMAAGYESLAPVREEHLPQCASLLGVKDTSTDAVDNEDASNEVATNHLASHLHSLAALLTVTVLIAPLGGVIRAATKALELWDDRSLRVLYLDSPTVLAGVGLGALSVLVAVALIADPLRRALATVTAAARAEYASHTQPRTQYDALGGDSRRVAALLLVTAAMGPLISGFGLGAASLPGYVVGALAAGLLVSAAAMMRSRSAHDSVLSRLQTRAQGHETSLADVYALTALSRSRMESAIAGVAGVRATGSFALATAVMTFLAAPLVVQFATDGTNPWIRPVAVIAAVLLIAGVAALARGVSEPVLEAD